jgi:hypothetical protein
MRIRIKISDALKKEIESMKGVSFRLAASATLIYLASIFYFGALITIILAWFFMPNTQSFGFSLLAMAVFGVICVEEYVLLSRKNPTIVMRLFVLVVRGIHQILYRSTSDRIQEKNIYISIKEGFFVQTILRFFSPSKF